MGKTGHPTGGSIQYFSPKSMATTGNQRKMLIPDNSSHYQSKVTL
jgi:hypothetical protein